MGKINCNIDKCLGCKSCEIACAVEHSTSKTLFNAIREDKTPRRRVTVESSAVGAFPLRCQHCEDPRCVQSCMSGAFFKDEDGAVRHDPSKCVGCWMCIMVCPFGSISRSDKKAIKCDLCSDRKESYACVSACPTKALRVEGAQ